jgi:hypothetical protein
MDMPVRFFDAARLAFGFLEERGFSVVARRDNGLEYQSEASRVKVEWDHRSGKVTLFVGVPTRGDELPRLHSLREVLRLRGVFREDVEDRPHALAEASWTRCLGELAHDLRTHGEKALSGDRTFFSRLDLLKRLQEQVFREDARRWSPSLVRDRRAGPAAVAGKRLRPGGI